MKEVCCWREAATHVKHDPEKHSIWEEKPRHICAGVFYFKSLRIFWILRLGPLTVIRTPSSV